MKGSNVHKIGPLRTTEARHVDGQMLKLQFQVWNDAPSSLDMLPMQHTPAEKGVVSRTPPVWQSIRHCSCWCLPDAAHNLLPDVPHPMEVPA
jgi:hypothetical protein